MRLMKLIPAALLGLSLASGLGTAALASGEGTELKHQHWHFQGFFGQYDKAAALRGFQIFEEICSACHAAKYFRFRDLEALGLSKDQVKAIAANHEVDAEPDAEGLTHDDNGERLKRTALQSDVFPAPFPNDLAAAAVHGKTPPDLSLLAKSREGGADYIYSLLTSYIDADHLSEEQQAKAGDLSYNAAFPGNVIAMAQPLDDGSVEYVDGTEATLDQHAKDVAEFLMWVAEPNLDKRKRLGWAVLLFMIAFTVLAYLAYRRVHARVHNEPANGPWPLH